MNLITKVTKSGIARVLAIALIVSGVASFVQFSNADHSPIWGHAFDVTVNVRDEATGQAVSGVELLLVADNRSHPDHALTGTSDGNGRISFDVHRGPFTLEFRHGSYHPRDVRVNFIADATINVQMAPKDEPNPFPTPVPPPGPINPNPGPAPTPNPEPTPTPSPTPGCTPTPPNGRAVLNYWPISESGVGCTDFSMLAAKNVTRGTGYVVNSTLSAEDEEIIRFQIYVHNGTIDLPENIAHNVMVKLNQSGRGTVSAEAWANDADKIVSSSKGGNINLDIAHGEHLEVIPGSGKIYSRTGSFLGGISAEAVNGSGASLGDQRGCFEFARFVTLDFRVVEPVVVVPAPVVPPVIPPPVVPTTGTLTVTKQVINNNGGTATVADFPLFVNSTLVTSGTANTLTAGTYTVSETNRAGYTASFSGACNANGVVSLGVGQNLSCVITNDDIAPNPGSIDIQKTVRNVTDSQTVFTDSTAADPSEQVEFQMQVTVSGNTVSNINVSDVLPSRLSYVNNSLRVDGVASGNNITSISLGSMAAGTTKNITFRANVAASSEFTDGSTPLTNIANLTSSAGSDMDTAQVIVQKVTIAQPTPLLSIIKQVRNVSQNQTGFVETTTALPGEQVEFKIDVTASNATANNVVLTDVLPNNFSLNFATTGSGVTQNSSTSFSLGNMTAGSTRTLLIRATAASEASFPVGSSTWTNTATASSSNTPTVSDSAQVIVTRGQVAGGIVNLVLAKRAFNVTQGKDATTVTANAGDVIDYVLSVQNTGNATATGYVIEDNLADVLQLSNLIQNGGGTLDGTILRWAATDIAAGVKIEKVFSVRVKSPVPAGTDLVMTNVYGNTVNVKVKTGQVLGTFTAPKTGSPITLSVILALATMAGVVGVNRFKKQRGIEINRIA